MAEFTDIKFISDLHLVRYKKAKNDKTFFLSQPYKIAFKRDGKREIYTCHKGFGTDLASVPRPLRWLASKVDGIEGSVIHDHIYDLDTMPRKEADDLFLEIMKAGKVSWVTRNIMWTGVRIGGWLVY